MTYSSLSSYKDSMFTDNDNGCLTHYDAVDNYFYREHPFTDFCKRVDSECVRIFSSDNFYLIARLPLAFKNLSCQDIVSTLYGIPERMTSHFRFLQNIKTQEEPVFCPL